MKKLLFAIAALLVAVTVDAQTEIKVETHRVVSEGEQFNLTFIIEGENSASDFNWTPTDDFQVLWGPQSGRSTSISIVNGKRTKSVQSTYTYVMRAMTEGTFTIPAATATVKGTTISSQPVSIQVVRDSGASSSAQQSQSQPSQQQGYSSSSQGDIFLDMSISENQVVVGEPVIATLKLYQRVNVAGFEGVSFPSFDGFWSQELEAPKNIEFSRETYNGQIYNAALLRKFVLIPQQQGTLTIDPAELVCILQIRVSPSGSSIFDGFFDDYKTVRQKVTSKPLKVKVSPLPAGAPASFGGGVGQFTISASLSKDVLKAHEAASLIITVSGKGNISLLEAPKVTFPPDMEVYDTKVSDRIQTGGLSGSKTYEYPFIPRSHGEFVIEPVKYSYYDIASRKYVTLETEPLTLTVEKGQAQEASTVYVSPGRTGVRNIGEDIRFINIKDAVLASKGTFFVASPWFLIAAAVILLLAFVTWLSLRKIARRKADVAGTRNRKATKMAMKRLSNARLFLDRNLQTAFYEELHKALLGFVADKLNAPVAELSRENISELLSLRGVSGESVGKYIGLLEACEFARYAPEGGSDAMSAHYQAAVDVISAMDTEMKINAKNPRSTTAAYVLAFLLLALPTAMRARQTEYVDSLWNESNKAYTEGRWEDAVAGYEMISGMNLESAALYCNAADAYFKAGNLPKAVLNYERALKIDPSYDDARFNLEFVSNLLQDRIDPVPDFILKVWAKKICWLMDSDAWAVAFLVLLALTAVMVLLFILAPSLAGRRAGFYTGIVTLLLAVSALSFSLWQKNDYMRADEAVVMRPVSSVKSSPTAESSQDLFVLHEGTKVKILDHVGSWNNIELADGRQGWIRSSEIELI